MVPLCTRGPQDFGVKRHVKLLLDTGLVHVDAILTLILPSMQASQSKLMILKSLSLTPSSTLAY